MRTRLWISILAGVPLLPACRSDTAVLVQVPNDAISVQRVAGGLRVTNGSTQVVAYAAWNRDFIGLFAPCVDTGPSCPRLTAGSSVVVADSQVTGAAQGMRTVFVRWWRVVPDGSGAMKAVELHEITVELPASR